MIPLIYVAGPFSPTAAQKERIAAGVIIVRQAVEENILRAKRLGLEVAKLGACPWIPHANTDLPEFEHVQPYTFWIDVTAEQLRRCDAAIFTDDFAESSGARGEERIAIDNDKPRFYNTVELKLWLLRRQSPGF